MTTYPPVPEPPEPERRRPDEPGSHEGDSSGSEPARPAWDKVEPQPPHQPAWEQGLGKSQPPAEPAREGEAAGRPLPDAPPWTESDPVDPALGPTEPQRGLEEPGPNDPDPVEPNQSPSSDPERNRPEPDRPEPEPFSGNPAPPERGPDPERDPGGVPPEDPVPGASAEGAPPPSAPQPAAPPPPPPSGAGYSPYAGGAVPPAPPPPGYSGGGGEPRYGEPSNGMGTAALVCGIIAVVLSFIPGINWFSWPLGILAIVFGAIGWGRANKGRATNKGIAITGLVLGILSFFTLCLISVIIGASSGSMYYGAAPML